jgi:CBS domain-containing protein
MGKGNAVGNWMKGPVHWVAPQTTLSEALAQLESKRVSCLAVCEADGRPLGVLSRTDLLAAGRVLPESPEFDLSGRRVEEVMTRHVLTISAGAACGQAAGTMIDRQVHRLFVERDGRLIGVFSTRDAMNALAELGPEMALADYMSQPVATVDVLTTSGEALEALQRGGITGLVVNEGEWPVGVFTQREVLSARQLPLSTPVEEVMSASMLCLQAKSPLYRAAALAATTRARRVLAVEGRHMVGILTGMDFTRALRDVCPG